MTRLLTREGEELCYLAHLVVNGVNFVADVAPCVAARETHDEAVLQTDAAHHRVIVDSWDVIAENGRQVGRVRGRIASKL
jgi:hypothetical protein